MFYGDDFIEEVRQRNPIQDVIGQYVHLTKKGGSYFGLCPFHNEKTPSFCVTPSKQIYHCFGCGVGGNVLSFVMEYENLTFPEAVKMLAERAGMSVPEERFTPKSLGRMFKLNDLPVFDIMGLVVRSITPDTDPDADAGN